MIQSKKINIIVAAAMVFALIISSAFVVIANTQTETDDTRAEPDYATEIFGTNIISVEIIADQDDWQEMLDNAASEQYIMVDVIVNGTKFENVGIRPKGNSSLSQVVNSDSDRYSFRLQFDEYIDGQTCFGLDSFVLNNMFTDNTYMKEYVSYDLMWEAGVDAPYFGYADIQVNGESWGLYLAVERYDESYEQRVFGDTSGMLYNVKSAEIGEDANQSGLLRENGQMPDGQDVGNRQMPGARRDAGQLIPPSDGNAMQGVAPNAQSDGNVMPDGDVNAERTQQQGENVGMDRQVGRGSTGGSLEYIDDNTESYSAIFSNVVGKGTESDFERVVRALEALSEGEDLETYFDVDQILRYLAAHTIVVNLDSYSSSMAQNYYIYERDGQITILPWDYNQAWGGFQSTDAVSVINFPIDTPVSGVEMSSRPLIEKLFANTEYLERYHSYLQELIDNYFADGQFEEKINTLDALIDDYVKNDPTAFCTYEEYKTAVDAFIELGNLRAESVQGQLDGTVPSTTQGQSENPDQLISAGTLMLADLGSTSGGGGGDRGGFSKGNIQNAAPTGNEGNADNSRLQTTQGEDVQVMNEAMGMIRQSGGEITDEVKDSLLSLGLTAEQIEQFSAMGGNMMDDLNGPDNSDRTASFDGAAPTEQGADGLVLTVALLAVLVAALIFAAKLKRSY